MLSPAARHRQKILARQAAAKAPEGVAAARPKDGPEASAYELLLAELGKDLARLREVQSVEGKIALKREMIVSYDHHVDATLDASAQSGKAVQDEIVATMMIWRFDIGDFAAGLEIAAHVLRFGLAMPQRMQRQAATLIAEEVAEAALAMDRDGHEFSLAIIDQANALTAEHDMPDQVRAKLFKARGRSLRRAYARLVEHPESAPAGGRESAQLEALAAFRRALQLDKKCGVKKDIEQLEAKVRAAND
ncbi:MAG: hypothetical protein BGP16_12955 [Sphingobium sp. 66-54]|nr:MAG: hypothetical protein BGP16_12955 [Sphingobium sp. 66-54]